MFDVSSLKLLISNLFVFILKLIFPINTSPPVSTIIPTFSLLFMCSVSVTGGLNEIIALIPPFSCPSYGIVNSSNESVNSFSNLKNSVSFSVSAFVSIFDGVYWLVSYVNLTSNPLNSMSCPQSSNIICLSWLSIVFIVVALSSKYWFSVGVTEIEAACVYIVFNIIIVAIIIVAIIFVVSFCFVFTVFLLHFFYFSCFVYFIFLFLFALLFSFVLLCCSRLFCFVVLVCFACFSSRSFLIL